MKKALKVEAQIERLKKRGMKFGDEEKAKEILLDVGYYRLGFYSFPFERTYPRLEHRDHKFKEGTTFEDVLELYYFDSDLRRILANYLYRIEVNVRTQITYVVSNHYRECPTWFVNPNVVSQKYINSFNAEVYRAVQTEIARRYNCSFGIFCNYMETIRLLRNKCAHGRCLYNMVLSEGVKLQPANVEQKNRHNVSGAIKAVIYMLKQISVNRAQELITNLNDLLNVERSQKVAQVIESCMGHIQIFE